MSTGKTNYRRRRNRRAVQSSGPGSQVNAIWTPYGAYRINARVFAFNVILSQIIGTAPSRTGGPVIMNMPDGDSLPVNEILAWNLDSGLEEEITSAVVNGDEIRITIAADNVDGVQFVIPSMLDRWGFAAGVVCSGGCIDIG